MAEQKSSKMTRPLIKVETVAEKLRKIINYYYVIFFVIGTILDFKKKKRERLI